MNKQAHDLLSAGSAKLGIALSPQILDTCVAYIEQLLKWNRVYNLTAITDVKAIVARHFLDSFVVTSYLKGERILDVGTGAGFPGIPLALINPNKSFSLLDSNGKKTRFLTQVVADLGMTNVSIIQSRVEDYQSEQCFHTIVSRAFSQIDDMIDQCKHLLCEGGVMLALKGKYPTDELTELHAEAIVHRLEIPGLDAARHVVCITGVES